MWIVGHLRETVSVAIWLITFSEMKEMKSKVEAARDSEKKTKKQLDDTENERRRLEKALLSARDELDST